VGGLGSGRRRTRLGTDECRALEIGELCDGGRREALPAGEVEWRALSGGQLRARLAYVVTGQESAGEGLLLDYRYWPECDGPFYEDEIELEALPGRRTYALCPTCGQRVRSLYARPRALRLACRSCCGLVYRRPEWHTWLAYLREVAGPALSELEALPRRTRRRARRRYVPRPPAALARELEAELPLGENELALWCLRLRAAGLSYREIAELTESSKSGAARICAAGPKAISTQGLIDERTGRASAFPAPPEGDDPRARQAYLGALHRHALALISTRCRLRSPRSAWSSQATAHRSPEPSAAGWAVGHLAAAKTSSAISAAASSCIAGMACE